MMVGDPIPDADADVLRENFGEVTDTIEAGYETCLMHGIEHAARMIKMEAEKHYTDRMMTALRPDLLREEP